MKKSISHQHFFNCAVIFFLTFIVFWPTLKNDFIHYDDMAYVLANPLIRDLSWGNVTKIFSNIGYGGLLFPFSIFTYAIEYHFFQLNPWIYHFDNLFLHAINAILVYVFIWLISGRSRVALITAVLFTINPLRVESVAWIAERKDVLSSLFYLGALISYVYAVRNEPVKRGYFIGTCGLFILSLLSKEQAVTLPFVLLAVDFLFNRISIRNILIEKLPIWIITIGNVFIVWASFNSQAQTLPSASVVAYSLTDKFFLMHYAVLVYFFKNFASFKLSLLYPYPEKISGYFNFLIYCSPIIVYLMILFFIKFATRSKFLIFGILFFFILIALPIILICYNAYFVPDHYMYLPSIGLFYPLAYVLDKILQKRIIAVNKICYLLFGGYIVFMSIVSYQYCKLWKSDITIWTHVIDQYPNAPLTSIAYNNRGHTYQTNNEWEKALSDLNKAIDLSGRYKDAYVNRALLYLLQNRYTLAIKDYSMALSIDPVYIDALNNLGFIYVSTGQNNQGIELLTKSIKIYPNYSLFYFNRGRGYMNLKQYKEAAQDFYTTVSLDPRNIEAQNKYHEALSLL